MQKISEYREALLLLEDLYGYHGNQHHRNHPRVYRYLTNSFQD